MVEKYAFQRTQFSETWFRKSGLNIGAQVFFSISAGGVYDVEQ